jgi:ribonucleoside-diphosphate reductase alpha chain
MSTFTVPIAKQIWDQKYRFKEADGTPIDDTVEDSWDRISGALAVAEDSGSNDKTNVGAVLEHANTFYNVLSDFKFLPAGRITAGAGTGRQVTLFNCFVMGTIPDSMSGIFDMLKEAALTMQQGGGIGYDFSTIRPKNALVEGVAADASGPLTFMDCWDAMCRTVMSAGSRRGAMMATMSDSHPDVEDFIVAKQEASKLRMFNMSVLISDAFMHAVKTNQSWDLHFTDKHGVRTVYKTVSALKMWNDIMASTYDFAEPGVIFIDRINRKNNLNYCELIAATNPCGEQPLPPYGACLLGSMNMAKYVKHPFTGASVIDYLNLERDVATAIRMMDNVVDVSLFPLDAQRAEAKAKRRLGLGVTGIGDMLIMLGKVYGSEDAAQIVDSVMYTIARAAYWASVELAKEKGAFPLFEADAYLHEHSAVMDICREDSDLEDAIRTYGIRNALLTSIAPTGTISMYAGNVSSGIEPVFAYEYTRKILNKDGSHRFEAVTDYALNAYRQFCDDNGMDVPDVNNLPPEFVSAQTLPPEAHIRMQAAAQKWVDSSISKTINLPKDISFEDFKAVYMSAWDQGCKGCTTYRPNDVTGSVLMINEEPKPEPLVAPEGFSGGIAPRVEDLQGHTYKIKMAHDDPATYVTLNYLETDGVKKPFEIFINSKSVDHFVWAVALTRTISAVFRSSPDSTFLVEELKSVFDPKGGAWMGGKYVPSIIAAIGGAIERFMLEIGYIDSPADVVPAAAGENDPTIERVGAPELCQKCHSSNLKFENGCPTCLDCGHSKCG